MAKALDFSHMVRLRSINAANKGPAFEPSAKGWVKPDGSCVKYHLSGVPGSHVTASERKSVLRPGRHSPFAHEWTGRDLCGGWGGEEGIRRALKARLLLHGTAEQLEAAGAVVDRTIGPDGRVLSWCVSPGSFVDKGAPAPARETFRRQAVLSRRAKARLLLERYRDPKK